jgi:hypothetical protein
MALSVAWVFSLARSGSSIVAYAAAAGVACPVADEILGPWDRTCEPYLYPAEQPRLAEAFAQSGYMLDPACIELANSIFLQLAGTNDRIVSKYPHLIEPPGMFESAFPGHRSIFLLRNPLHRLNSMHTRNQTAMSSASHDMDRFKAFAQQWQSHPNRMIYDDMRRDTLTFFRRVYDAWEWPVTDAQVVRAATYTRMQYHSESGVVDPGFAPPLPLSERRRSLTAPIVEQYLGDPMIRDLMEQVGWSTEASAYLPEPDELATARVEA